MLLARDLPLVSTTPKTKVKKVKTNNGLITFGHSVEADTVNFGNARLPLPRVLEINNQGRFITPSHIQYHHQWLWDAAFHAIVLTQYDPEMAKQEINTLLEAQWDNGFIPHIQFNPSVEGGYRPNASDWSTGHQGSGITQPPLIATAVREIYEATQDDKFLGAVFPKILAYHQWLKADRDSENTGLLSIVHPWEAGTDNSPIFDALREKLWQERYHNVEPFPRVDTDNVDASQRPGGKDYQVYWGLVEDFKAMGWNQSEIAKNSPFSVADPLFNSVWAKANEDLAYLAQKAGYISDFNVLTNWSNQTKKAMRQNLWSRKDKIFYAKDLRSNELIPVKTISGLVPLYAGVPSWLQTRRLVQHLNNPNEFNAPRGITSTSMDEASFDPQNYWRGPVWINTMWFIVQGLQRLGKTELASRYAEKAKALVNSEGFREYYHPLSGEGLGAPDFSWSTLALTL